MGGGKRGQGRTHAQAGEADLPATELFAQPRGGIGDIGEPGGDALWVFVNAG